VNAVRLLRLLLVPLAAALIVALASGVAAAQENDLCLACHGEADMTVERDGKKISLFVEEKDLQASVHSKLDCITCHEDLDGVERFPHDKVGPVDCAKCHDKEGEKHAKSLHGLAHAKGDPMAPTCADCHDNHRVLRAKDPAARTSHMNIPLLCGSCHHEGSPVSRTHDIPQERILENYSESMHGEGLFKKGLAVTAVCTSCHTPHDILPHTDPASSIHHDNIVKTCTQCHVRIEQVHRKVIEGKLWEEEPHKIPVCVDCHQPHKARRVFYSQKTANKDCMGSECHGKPDLSVERYGRRVSLFVDEAAYAASTHKDTGCAQCHIDVDPAHERPCDSVKKKVDCSACHAQEVADHSESTHGTLAASGDPDAPLCKDCHDVHATRSRNDPASPTAPRNQPALCARCHSPDKVAGRRIHADVPDIVGAYAKSVHGKGLIDSGLLVSATCVSCHTQHRQLPPGDPRSSLNPAHLPDTCGKCHQGVQQALAASVHGGSGPLPEGRRRPVCNDCHTSHEIARTDSGFRAHVADRCGQCHAEQSKTFFETFHGKATRLAGDIAAKCEDCHGAHDVLPLADPKSRMHEDRRAETCARCHKGAHAGFAGYMPHADPHDPDETALHWTFVGMTGLLVGTMIVALLHTALWLVRLWTTRAEWGPHRRKIKEAIRSGQAKYYRRFRPSQSVSHGILVFSFLTLALTGMALKFSWTGWAGAVSGVFGGFERMGTLHRTAAALLLGLFVFHLRQLSVMRREAGVSWLGFVFGPDSMMFGRRDWEEFRGTLLWFVGRGPRPRYGRFTYWEKFDYFAVFWGVAVIGLSGLILWFPVITTHVLPGWAINVAALIHGDEALLAVAFIFTIHFFNTQFRPDRFPLDVSVFTGMVPLEEQEFERPRELEAAKAAGVFEERLVTPHHRHVEGGIRLFAVIALVTGLALVFGIAYALIGGTG